MQFMFDSFSGTSFEIDPDREVTVFKKTTKLPEPTEADLNFPTNLKWKQSDRWAKRTRLVNVAYFRHSTTVIYRQSRSYTTFWPICSNPALPKSSIFDGQISKFQTALTLRVLNRFCSFLERWKATTFLFPFLEVSAESGKFDFSLRYA